MVDVAPARSTSLMKSRALKKNLQLCDAVTEEADAVLRGYTTHLTSLVSVVEHVAVQAKVSAALLSLDVHDKAQCENSNASCRPSCAPGATFTSPCARRRRSCTTWTQLGR